MTHKKRKQSNIQLLHFIVVFIWLLMMAAVMSDEDEDSSSRQCGTVNIRRERIPVETIFCNLGQRLVRRAYRITEASFWKLFHLIKPHMPHKNKRKRGCTPNGDIDYSARLSMALRWFAGGDAIDIMQTHGVSNAEVYRSVWMVVDAINACPELQIRFPRDYTAQQELARAFKRKSFPEFDNCVGCIDGMLVWINKPSKPTLRDAGLGARKFFCGRKKKFGLNLQAICDHLLRFIDVEIIHPGATSDYLSFATSFICTQLKETGFLMEGLTIYGDNAYINSPFMTTPYKGATGGLRDSFNFFHSQLRISIECAFGMLVHRWGVLRKAIPVNVSLEKTCMLVRALCMLHNFCIDEREATADPPTASDLASTLSGGGFVQDNPVGRVNQLMDGGNHFEGVPESQTRLYRHCEDQRERLLNVLAEKGLTERPNPRGSTTTNSRMEH